MDWVGFEPTTTYVSPAFLLYATKKHARQVFYRTKLPAHRLNAEK